MRAALEGRAGELFAANATDEQIARLSDVADRMADAARAEPPEVTLGSVAEFYQVLFDGSCNRVCAQFIQSLNSRISMFRRMSIASHGRSEAMMDEVENMVSAARARDAGRLKQACIEHVEAAGRAAVSQLAAQVQQAG